MGYKDADEFREEIYRIMAAQMARRNDPGIIVEVSYSPLFDPHRYKRIENGGWYEWLIGAKLWSFRVSDSDLLEAVYQAGKESQTKEATEWVERVAARIESEKELEEKENTE